MAGGGLEIDFQVKATGFDGDEAGEAPIGGSELADEVELRVAGRLEVADVGLDEGLEGLLIFAAKDRSELGKAAMLESVHGRAGLALDSFGAAGFGAITPGGLDLFLGKFDY